MAEIGTRPPRCAGPVALVAAAAALVLAGPAVAQSAAPEIEAAEAAFAAQLAQVQQPLLESYSSRLAELGGRLVAQGGAGGAEALRGELAAVRLALASGDLAPLLASAPGGAEGLTAGRTAALAEAGSATPPPLAQPGDIRVLAVEAETSGQVTPCRALDDGLVGFDGPGDRAVWRVAGLERGRGYDVFLEAASGLHGGGTAGVEAGAGRSEVAVSAAGGWRGTRLWPAGRVTADGGPVRISVEANDAAGPFGVMVLEAVVLRPRPGGEG